MPDPPLNRSSFQELSEASQKTKLKRQAQVSRKTAQKVEEALTRKLREVSDWVLTLTADNGKEFANHQTIASKLGATVYFARPYHSWKRGLNEHTNGLIRQYLPKNQRLDTVANEVVWEIENLLRWERIAKIWTGFAVIGLIYNGLKFYLDRFIQIFQIFFRFFIFF